MYKHREHGRVQSVGLIGYMLRACHRIRKIVLLAIHGYFEGCLKRDRSAGSRSGSKLLSVLDLMIWI